MSLFPYMGAPQGIQGGLLSSQPYMGTPTQAQSPLLGAASSYSYPLTSGLLGSIGSAGGVGPWASRIANPSVAAQQAQMSQTPPDYTALALQLAGNPHAGPYSTSGNLVQPGSSGSGSNPSAGSTSGGSTGSQLLGGLLGVLKNPQAAGALENAVNGLLGNGLDTYASGAAANQAVSSALGNTANDGTAGNVQASNDASLNSTDGGSLGAGAGLLSTDNIGSGLAANTAVTGELGGVGSQTADEAAAIQAANDAALGGAAAGSAAGLLGGYGSGAAADAAVASQLGNVANDGTGAAVQAANDAALNATDGGAAGAGAGASSGALGAAGKTLGALGAAYSAYNTIKNWQSGNTGSDALNGAQTGAAIGTEILPGVGTVIGGLLGGAAGALSSAFGPGETDPENVAWDQYVAQYNKNPSIASALTPYQAYQNLAGVMDAKDNSAGHSQPLEQVFGKMGEQNLMDQMTNYINQQEQAGKIKPGESVQDQWNQVIYPWLQSKGASINAGNTAQGNPEGAALTNDLQTLVGQWENGLIAPTGSPFVPQQQLIGGINTYAGMTPQQKAAYQQLVQKALNQQNLQSSMIGHSGAFKRPASGY